MRQHFAQIFINTLVDGRRIINFDESSITFSNFCTHSWTVDGKTVSMKKNSITPQITFVAAVDS